MMNSKTTVKSHIFQQNCSNQWAEVFVYSIWLIMMLIAIICLIYYGRNIPLGEDWYMVAPLTDNEPNFGSWLWSSVNGHRVPLPRLILLDSIKVTKDFRSGMVLNLFTLGAASLISILVARSIRCGRTYYTDAFFPIIMLNLGNWAALFWGWQFTQVLPTALGYSFFLVLICDPTLSTTKAALVAGICLILLPLCGGNGLILVPLLGIWTVYCIILQLGRQEIYRSQLWIPSFLICSAFLSLCLIILYLMNYEQPLGYPASPGLRDTLKTAAQFLAISFGPIAITKWFKVSIFAVFGFLYIPVVAILLVDLFRGRNESRNRSLAILLVFIILVLYALVLAHTRTGWLLEAKYFPLWYMIFPLPFSCIAFLTWKFYGHASLKRFFQASVCILLILLLPLNTMTGFSFGYWYEQGMKLVEKDVQAGIQVSDFTRHHRDFLIHWWSQEQLEEVSN